MSKSNATEVLALESAVRHIRPLRRRLRCPLGSRSHPPLHRRRRRSLGPRRLRPPQVIGATTQSQPLLTAAGVVPDAGVPLDATPDTYLTQVANGRIYDREPNVKTIF